MVRVRLPTPLRAFADDRAEVVVEAGTVGGALAGVIGLYPHLRRHLYGEDGALRSFVNVYLNDEDVRYLAGEGTEVRDGDVVTIVPSIAGGSGGGREHGIDSGVSGRTGTRDEPYRREEGARWS